MTGLRPFVIVALCGVLAQSAWFMPESSAFETEVVLGQVPDAKYEPKKIVPFVPTPQEVVEGMLELAQVKKGDVVYDLGSGDGRIVITAAKKYGVRAVGFEIDPDLIR